MRKTSKLLALLMATMLVFSVFAACGETESQPAEGGEEGNGSGPRTDLVVATANEPGTIAPFMHSAIASSYIDYLLFDRLMRTDPETLDPVPSIITDWEVADDQMTWTFHIRDDVDFSNGEHMTADDVVATMQYAKANPAYTSNYSDFWETVEKVDDYTFTLKTGDVYARTLNGLGSYYVLPKSLIDAGNDFNNNPVGSGPYTLVSWSLGDNLILKANDNYWGGAPAIKDIKWRIIPEGSSRTIALEAGEVDFVIEVETNDLQRLMDNEDITVINRSGLNFNFMMINNERHPFNNKDFRHALNCAIDKNALVEVALNGTGTGDFGQTPFPFRGFTEENIDKYDVELAKQYIEKSGIDPTTISFSCICSDDVKRRCGEVIQASLAELGITMTLESMDLATYMSTAAEGNYDAAIGGTTSSEMLGFIEYKFTNKMIGSSNFSRTNEPFIEETYVKANRTLDADERYGLVEQMCAYLNELCPQVPTYIVNVVRAHNSNLKGYDVMATGYAYLENCYWAD